MSSVVKNLICVRSRIRLQVRLTRKIVKEVFSSGISGAFGAGALGPFQTSNFSCAESNANEKNLMFSLICIRSGPCKVRRLTRALSLKLNFYLQHTEKDFKRSVVVVQES